MTAAIAPMSSTAEAGELPLVSVIVPCRNEVRFIGGCLDSILAADYPADRLEVIVVDGMSTDGTRDLLAQRAAVHPNLRIVDNPRGITPAALNIAVRAARGDLVMRADAHAAYPRDYVAGLVRALARSDADIVGGVLETVPARETPVARAIAAAMSSPFGVGNSRFRIGTAVPRYVDHIAFFCCRRELFARVGSFDEELVRSQDGEFSFRVIKSGGKILLDPSVSARYFARESVRAVGRMFYQYGFFKTLTARKIGRVMTVRQLVPALFMLVLVQLAALSMVWRGAAVLLAALLGAYALVLLAAAASVARRHGPAPAGALAVVLPVMHFSYGWGYLRGVAEHVVGLRLRRAVAAEVPLSR